MPSSPAVATRILALADNPRATVQQFARAICADGALAARLIKMCNSAAHGLATRVTTIERAVAVLGLGRVRTAALGFHLVGHLNKLGGVPFDMKAYWRTSALRACILREVAQRVVPNLAEEGFLVGLLCESGVLPLVQILGAEYAAHYMENGDCAAQFYSGEKQRFPYTHVDAVTVLVDEWKLPEIVQKPIVGHHRRTPLSTSPTDVDRLCAAAYLVNSLRFHDPLGVEGGSEDLAAYASEELKLEPAAVAECLKAATASYKETAELLGGVLPEDVDVTELLSEANRHLMEFAGSAESRAGEVEAARRKLAQEQETLKSALGVYRDRAARDPLTGVLNRGALTDVTNRILFRAGASQASVSAYFLDLDDFKKLNDTFGHQAGDEVLKAVASKIQAAVVNNGCLGRYGGEEFVVVLAGLNPAEFTAKAAEIVGLVRTIECLPLGIKGPVTCSLGAAFSDAAECHSAEQLFAAADAMMYLSKRGGKDRHTVRALKDIEKSAEGGGGPSGATTGSGRQTCGSAKPSESKSKTAGTPAADCQQRGGADDQFANYRAIAERLNAQKLATATDDRKEARRDVFASCNVTTVTDQCQSVRRETGFVRNLSGAGVGLLVCRPLSKGDPVEIELRTPNGDLYIAGLVSFSRHIEGPFHDVGVQVCTHSKSPILSADPAAAGRRYPWLNQAITAHRPFASGAGH